MSGQGQKLRLITAIIIVVILAVALLVGGQAVRRYESYLSGLWAGDPAFLRKARLTDMQLFIAPMEGGCRQGYLIMTDLNGNFVANRAIEIRERSTVQRWWTALKSALRSEADTYAARHVEIDYDVGSAADGLDPPMPEHLKMALSILGGSLTLYDDAKVWAFLVKDHQTSTAAIEAYTS